MFDVIFFIVLIFVVISWIGGAAGKAGKASGNRGPAGGYQKTSAGYARTGSRETSVSRQNSAGQDWISQLQNLEGKLTQAARGNKPQLRAGASGRSNLQNRFNNSPVAKSSFNNHSEASGYITDEVHESKVLWAMNHQDMDRVNLDFNTFVARQHQENQRMMKDAQSLDR